MPVNLENSIVTTGLKKISFSFQSQRKAMPKNVQTCSFHRLASNAQNLSSYASIVHEQRISRWCCLSAALNIPANLENSAVTTGLEKVSFHSNPKEK